MRHRIPALIAVTVFAGLLFLATLVGLSMAIDARDADPQTTFTAVFAGVVPLIKMLVWIAGFVFAVTAVTASFAFVTRRNAKNRPSPRSRRT